jgi:hypothetical protein
MIKINFKKILGTDVIITVEQINNYYYNHLEPLYISDFRQTVSPTQTIIKM